MKTCCVCKGHKTAVEFGPDLRRPDGKQGACRECCRVRERKYRHANLEEYNTKCAQRRRDKRHDPVAYAKHRAYEDRTREERKAYKRQVRDWLRREMLEAYGAFCHCPGCNATAVEFLTLEHLSGGGGKHRKKKGAHGVYLELRKQGWPKDKYTVLCMNCNFAKGKYGYCPHDRAERAA